MARPPLVDFSGRVDSPYRGLGAFGERDQRFFYGRKAATRGLLAKMSDAATSGGMLIVSGVSGAGKSSLLQAGVLPVIRGAGLASAPGPARWTGLVVTPTREPLEQLALHASRVLGTDAARLHATLAAKPARFAITVRQLAQQSPWQDADGIGSGATLLIVDQFEQVFTQCTDDVLRLKFISALHAAATSGVALVVIVVRADFEARCADFPELVAAVKDRFLVTAMEEVELRSAIADPVATLAAAGDEPYSVEPSLIDHLVQDMLRKSGPGISGAGALPLLSYALDQAWRLRSLPVLMLADYERGGGIQGAVRNSADRIYDALPPGQQNVARQVFLRLAIVGDEGTTARDRVPREELLAVAGPGRRHDVALVLDAFTKERLITQGATDVEISHDALLASWPRLRDEWLAESRGDLAVMSRFRDTARKWGAGGRKPGLLYREDVLDEAIGAASRSAASPIPQPAQSDLEREFLGVSIQARQAEQRRSNSYRRLRQWLPVALGVFVVGLAIAVAVTSLSLVKANDDLTTANVQQMVAESTALRDINPAVSELAAASAWHAAASSQTRDLAVQAATNPLLATFDAVTGSMAVSPDGSVLAVGDSVTGGPVAGAPLGTEVTLWSVPHREVIAHVPLSSESADDLVFRPDEAGHVATLVMTTGDGIIVGQVSHDSYRQQETLLSGVDTSLDVISVSDSGTIAVDDSNGENSNILLFDDMGGKYSETPSHVLPNSLPLNSLSFAPDGSLAVGTDSGLRVYPPADGYASPAIVPPGAASHSPASGQFNSAGLLVIATSRQVTVDSYAHGSLAGVPLSASTQVSGNPAPLELERAVLSNQGVLAVEESNGLHLYDDSHLAAAGLIDAATLPYPGQQEPGDVEFSSDGNELIENFLGQIYVYSVPALIGSVHETSAGNPDGQEPPVMDFDPASPNILAAAAPSAVDLINVADNKLAGVLPGTGNASWVAFAPDGALAVITTSGLQLRPDPLGQPSRSEAVAGTGNATSVAFSPAGAMAVVSASKPELTVYPPGNYVSGAAITPRLPGEPGVDLGVDNVVFGPEGQLAAAVSRGDSPSGVAVFAPGSYSQQGYIADNAVGFAVASRPLAFGPDGSLAIASSADIQVYAPGHYASPVTINGAGGPDQSGYAWVAFSPGGILVSGDSSSGVNLWDPQTGQNLANFNPGANQQASGVQLVLSPDGRHLAYELSIEGSNTPVEAITIWSTPYLDGSLGDGVRSLCAQLAGTPEPGQWDQYFTSGLDYPRICP
ncbi:MAG TPA: AAA family ATPase [Trebonia sp.]|nr:AAA family ATPase [Trebonia sp.]